MDAENIAKARIERLEELSAWLYRKSTPICSNSGWGLEDLSVAVGVTFELYEVDVGEATEAEARHRNATCAERYRVFSSAVDLSAGFEGEHYNHKFPEQNLAVAWVFSQVSLLGKVLKRTGQSMGSTDFDQIERLSDELELFLLSDCTNPPFLIRNN